MVRWLAETRALPSDNLASEPAVVNTCVASRALFAWLGTTLPGLRSDHFRPHIVCARKTSTVCHTLSQQDASVSAFVHCMHRQPLFPCFRVEARKVRISSCRVLNHLFEEILFHFSFSLLCTLVRTAVSGHIIRRRYDPLLSSPLLRQSARRCSASSIRSCGVCRVFFENASSDNSTWLCFPSVANRTRYVCASLGARTSQISPRRCRAALRPCTCTSFIAASTRA